MSQRLLLVEDETSLARGLVDNFVAEGFDVLHVERGDDAEAAASEFDPHVVLLDLMLPGLSGLDVLRALRRQRSELPIVVLTAKGEVVDRVVGLELGADDYVSKPFDLRELIARVGAVLRRSSRRGVEAAEDVGTVTLGRVRFDFRAMAATGTPDASVLTVRDLEVLRVLLARRGEAVSRADILEEVAGLDSDATLRTIDNHVVALRRALGDAPKSPRFIRTVRGVGYRLVCE